MGKLFSYAGIALVLGLLFVLPASADSVTNYDVSGSGYNISFSLPTVLTPSSVNWGGMIAINNVSITINGNTFSGQLDLGPIGYDYYTNYFAIGDKPPLVQIFAPGLFTWNADGTVSLTSGNFSLADWYVGQPYSFSLTAVDPPVSTPEPASLALLGFGGLTLAAFRRRKTA